MAEMPRNFSSTARFANRLDRINPTRGRAVRASFCAGFVICKSSFVNENGFGRAVSRILSAPLRAERIICLGSRYPESARFRGTGAGRSGIPYLALHPMGFSVPRRLRFARWSLTPPFHPYRRLLRDAGGLIFCGTVRRTPTKCQGPPACIPAGRARVTRHRALWCSDFPPPACAGSDSPPFQNQGQHSGKRQDRQAVCRRDNLRQGCILESD